MIGYSATDVFSAQQQKLLRMATDIVESLPEEDHLRRVLRCHEVARAVAPCLGVPAIVIDGHFGSVDHSWIVLSDRPTLHSSTILDPYCVARLPAVQLCSMHYTVPNAYRPGPKRDDIRDGVVESLLKHALGLLRAPLISQCTMRARANVRLLGHCGESEQCADDVYCNCPCVQCELQSCHRPGCQCKKEHV